MRARSIRRQAVLLRPLGLAALSSATRWTAFGCIPRFPSRLNDLAIADFLLFDMNQDPSTTTFADIQRLPPAHTLECKQGAVSVRRYWELCVTTPVHFPARRRVPRAFPRTAGHRGSATACARISAGVLMSGGLDSTTVAASAQRVFACNGRASVWPPRVHRGLRQLAFPTKSAIMRLSPPKALEIPIEYLVSDQLENFRARGPAGISHPGTHAHGVARYDFGSIAPGCRAKSRGPDGLRRRSRALWPHHGSLSTVVQNRQVGPDALADAVRFLGAEGRLSRLYISTRWRILLASKTERSPIRHG